MGERRKDTGILVMIEQQNIIINMNMRLLFLYKKNHQNVQHHEQLITMNDSHIICMNRKFLVKRSMVLIFMTRKLFIQIHIHCRLADCFRFIFKNFRPYFVSPKVNYT